MKFRFYTLLFSVAIFILTAVGLAFLYYKTLVTPFWFTFAYIVAWSLVFAFAIDFFISDRKWSRKKVLLVTLSVMIIAIIASHSVWTVVTPRWSFSVTTDKSTYKLGENVQITVTLKNLGLIEHSFTSSLSDPVAVSVEIVRDPTVMTQAWYSSYHPNATEFTVAPHQSLERTFTWNQTWTTNLWLWNQTQTRVPGEYIIQAFVPRVQEGWPAILSHHLFTAYTTITITGG